MAMPLHERPANRFDAFVFDKKLAAGAWAAADALTAWLARERGLECERPFAQPRERMRTASQRKQPTVAR